MEHVVMALFISFATTYEVWMAVANTYFDGFDYSQIYELTCKAFSLSKVEDRFLCIMPSYRACGMS